MRRFLILVFSIFGLLVLSACDIGEIVRIGTVTTTANSTRSINFPTLNSTPFTFPTRVIEYGGSCITALNCVTATPIGPPNELILGRWVRVGDWTESGEEMEFNDEGTLFMNFGTYGGSYPYSFSDDKTILYIKWTPPVASPYSVEFQGNTLILTSTLHKDIGNRYVFFRNPSTSEFGLQSPNQIGPNRITISGHLFGPEGVLANQQIMLYYCMPVPDVQNCSILPSGFVARTDSAGRYRFFNVRPHAYRLAFSFTATEPDQIPDGALVESFVLKKLGSEITATGSAFDISGLESEITRDFIYPSNSIPPTATPTPTATSTPISGMLKAVPTATPTP